MKVLHLHTEDIYDSEDAALVEMFVRFTSGVSDIASVRSLSLISVLYDERLTSPATIIRSLRAAGFRVHTYQPQTRVARSLAGAVS